ncbi:unnamed protein product [Camellia sinensis]
MGPKPSIQISGLSLSCKTEQRSATILTYSGILRNCLITGPIPDYIGELSDLKILQWVAKDGELDFPKFYEDNHTSKKTNDWIHLKCRELHRWSMYKRLPSSRGRH